MSDSLADNSNTNWVDKAESPTENLIVELNKRAEEKADATWGSFQSPSTDEETLKAFKELHFHRVKVGMLDEEIVRTQANLDACNSRYLSLFDLSPVGLLTLDDRGIVRQANRRAVDLLAENSASLTGQLFYQAIHLEDRETFDMASQRLLQTSATYAHELRMIRPNGSPFWVRLEMRLLEQAVCQVAIIDIHEYKAEKERLEAEAVHRNTALQSRAQDLHSALAERDALLQEVHHRVRNNLQVISGILRMQAELTKDSTIGAVLEDSHRRFLSMALIQERFYQRHQIHRIDFEEYAHKLVDELFKSYADTATRITCRLNTSLVILGLDQAIPCGLILNELLSNALKHAYPQGHTGEVVVDLHETAVDVRLAVRDWGTSLPRGVDWQNPSSFGLQLVELLTRQIDGTLSVESGETTVFEVRFRSRS
jgi:PAS domain S-box-containing protein